MDRSADSMVREQTSTTQSSFETEGWKGGRLGRMILKELREILRDRRTIVTLVLMPLLLYPLISVAARQFFLASAVSAPAKPVYRIGFSREEEGDLFREWLALGDEESVVREERPELQFFILQETEQPLRDYQVDVIVKLDSVPERPLNLDEELRIDGEILSLSDSLASQRVLDYVQERLHVSNQKFLEARLKTLGTTQRGEPVRLTRVEVQGEEVSTAVSLVAVIPLILTLMTITGAVYPAIDLTAGERERGTLEILVAAPVSRFSLLTAKYVAVLSVASLTALVNLFSMFLTLWLSGLAEVLVGKGDFSFVMAGQVSLLLLIFAGFFSAILLALSSFARSFKEAQAYLVPLMLASLAPGLLSLLPGMKLQGTMVILPLANIVLLTRDLLLGGGDLAAMTLVVLSNLIYVLGAIALAGKYFGAEGVLYGTEGGWRQWFQRPSRQRFFPDLSSAMFLLVTLFPILFLVIHLLARLPLESLSFRLGLSGAATAGLFLLLPVWAARWGNISPRGAFAWQWPHVGYLVVGAVLGISLWPWALQLILWQDRWGLVPLDEAGLLRGSELVKQLREVPLLVILFSQALMPGVCEEVFFRGYLLGSMRGLGRDRAVLGSAMLFGVFHLVALESLALQRLLPSTFLGIALGWLCWRSGSLLPGIVLHIAHNALVMSSSHLLPWLEKWGWSTQEGDLRQVPSSWLLVSALGIFLAVGLSLAMHQKQLQEPAKLSEPDEEDSSEDR